MKIRCLIVDDEPLAREVLKSYVASLPFLELVAECKDAAEAIASLHQGGIDLMFLDIRMRGLNGLELLDTLRHPPLVIITTAYSKYALAGYEYAVVDYLLKPISFERFLKAVNTAADRLRHANLELPEHGVGEDFLFFKADGEDRKVPFSEIVLLEAYGNYIKVHTEKAEILVPGTMKSLEKRLPEQLFVRVHKSFIVSIPHIERIAENAIDIGKRRIPIGKHYKRSVEKAIEKLRLT